MKLKINGKDINFKFGVKFIRELDKHMPLEREQIKFGLGLSAKVLPELKAGNVNTLANVLYYANQTENEQVSLDEIDEYIDTVKDIEKLFDQVDKELRESNAGKLAMQSLEKNLI
ncbi:tail assembly chaperone [Melissococcus plutonius]|uniref:tail assembly chaperone n=1 Tax=Melissococcus plutonius TaxID=33970 RepID=UPI0021E582F6|nr:tail assembly chaperone [Melissococcus plutonius]MCV2499567.1 tail assembly chaperone [Melissococcus plutonius]MCV2501857.1 tail assembly chaperone [Melissococcus plutonius]MCV2505937.1 tail assembly chaperone [Melissococcus plutonius]MCV2508179.1 tail assembly chaperone [Melissococcus plutonius]MCV2528045.1 tail assembly chaperone [Melissococcus plutonius]